MASGPKACPLRLPNGPKFPGHSRDRGQGTVGSGGRTLPPPPSLSFTSPPGGPGAAPTPTCPPLSFPLCAVSTEINSCYSTPTQWAHSHRGACPHPGVRPRGDTGGCHRIGVTLLHLSCILCVSAWCPSVLLKRTMFHLPLIVLPSNSLTTVCLGNATFGGF